MWPISLDEMFHFGPSRFVQPGLQFYGSPRTAWRNDLQRLTLVVATFIVHGHRLGR